MLSKIVSKYALSDLLDTENGLAIADPNQKIIWYNKSFKETLGLKIIKGKKIKDLFPASTWHKPPARHKLNQSKIKFNETLILPDNKKLEISALKNENKIDGYYLKILKETQEKIINPLDAELLNRDLSFQNVLQEVLSILVTEKSISTLSEEILKRCVAICRGNFGIAIIFREDKKNEYVYFDEYQHLKNKKDAEKRN